MSEYDIDMVIEDQNHEAYIRDEMEHHLTVANQKIADLETRLAAATARVVELEGKLSRMTAWLDANQPDVFSRGIWDAILGEMRGGT